MPKHRTDKHRSTSQKRKPSGSPLEEMPAKAKPPLQSKLDFQLLSMCSSLQNSAASTEINQQDNPGTTPPATHTGSNVTSTPSFLDSSVFNFINEASADILTTKLSSALMLPKLQEKFQDMFLQLAREIISDHVKDILAPMQRKIVDLEEALEVKTDELEQYSRRNSLRLAGVRELPDENLDDIVMEVLRVSHPKINMADIDRCHRVGKKVPGGRDRRVLVKFISYQDRHTVIRNRRKYRL